RRHCNSASRTCPFVTLPFRKRLAATRSGTPEASTPGSVAVSSSRSPAASTSASLRPPLDFSTIATSSLPPSSSVMLYHRSVESLRVMSLPLPVSLCSFLSTSLHHDFGTRRHHEGCLHREHRQQADNERDKESDPELDALNNHLQLHLRLALVQVGHLVGALATGACLRTGSEPRNHHREE